MSDKLEYWISRLESEPIIQNNKYLLPIVEVQMYQISGQHNCVAKLHKANNKRTKEWHRKEVEIIWNMDMGLRREAFALCGDI